MDEGLNKELDRNTKLVQDVLQEALDALKKALEDVSILNEKLNTRNTDARSNS